MSATAPDKLEQIIGYRFADRELLHEALTHSSLRQGRHRTTHTRDFERLEFLGDAVLGLVVADLLFESFPEEREGELARRHAALVCGSTTVKVARSWDLGDYLLMTDSEETNGGRTNDTTLEDACEALLGALYREAGFEKAAEVIRTAWLPLSTAITAPPKDPKSTLQEWAQGQGKPIPEYHLVEADGPAHAPIFTIEVRVNGIPPAQATGSSKREAMQKAAEAMLRGL
jgi:ribonuclease-3